MTQSGSTGADVAGGAADGRRWAFAVPVSSSEAAMASTGLRKTMVVSGCRCVVRTCVRVSVVMKKSTVAW